MERLTLLQDLVRSQNDQLLNIRRLIDETMFRNDILLDELESFRLETHPTATKKEPQADILIRTAESLPAPAESPGEETADEEPSITRDLRYESSSGLNLPSPSQEQQSSHLTRSEAGRGHLAPFCSKEGPWKYLKSARKVLKGTQTSLLIVGDELTFDDERHTAGSLIKPQYVFGIDPNGGYKKSEYNKGKWTKSPTRCHQIIWRSGPSFIYLGTYETSFSKILDAAEFNALSAKVKNEIYLVTSSSTKKIKQDMKIPTLYQDGELLALQMECRRIGFDSDFHEALFEAAGLPLPGDTSTEPDVYYDAPSSDQYNKSSEKSHVLSPNEVPDLRMFTRSSEVTSNFMRAYSLSKSPKKALKKAKKDGTIKNLKGAVKIKHDEFIIDIHGSRPGFEVVPLQKISGSKKKGRTLKPKSPEARINQAQDIIVCRESQYIYLGKLIVRAYRALGVEEFQSLSPEVRKRVYEATFNGKYGVAEELRYATGELKAARLDFEFVDFNGDVERFLEGLMADGF